MSSEWLDRYIDVWALHPHAASPDGGAAMERLLNMMSDDVQYEDVPSRSVFHGHAGIVEMCAGAFRMSADLEHTIVSRQTDGHLFAFEWAATGTNTATGRPLDFRGIAVGNLSSDGLVERHRDYWDMAAFLAQMGITPGRGE